MRRGFSLIELLVVIAVIGILVATILASLSAAKGRGNDTGLKADLATIQTQGVIYYGIGNTYGASNTGTGASCTAAGTLFKDTTTTIDDPIGNAVASALHDAKAGVLLCQNSPAAFLVAGQLANGHYWCVDSVGKVADEASAPPNTAVACP